MGYSGRCCRSGRTRARAARRRRRCRRCSARRPRRAACRRTRASSSTTSPATPTSTTCSQVRPDPHHRTTDTRPVRTPLSLCFRHPLCLFKHRLSTFGRSVRRRRVRPRLFRTGARYTVRLVLYGRDRYRFIKNLSDRRSLKSRFV